ncbi:MAG: DNA/RNA nuclease SfsA [Robiginitomaculum sp.]|nr:MAG: DNA/RNA nuclease SfsA [Robiginitomaculum sp.]
MRFSDPLIEATLIQRYKRFLADVRLGNGEEMTVHCANPGSMMGLNTPGARVYISDSHNSKRKLRHSLELIEVDGALVGVHTGRANALAEEAILGGVIAPLGGYATLRREVKYGEASRVDFLLEDKNRAPCFVEVKSVTLSRSSGLAEFPDSVSKRAARHMDDLTREVKNGARAIVLFVVQREDCDHFQPAADIDPAYARALQVARDAGVEMLVYGCRVNPQEICITRPISFE